MSAAAETRREPWARFALKAGALLVAFYAAGSYAGERFRIGIDPQINRCLPGTRAVLIDRHDRTPVRGALIAFKTRGLEPFFADGTTFVKVADGLPGDRVRVSEEAVTVNGTVVGEGLALSATVGKPAAAFVRDAQVPAGAVWAMGRTADSYDSRYWGPVDDAQIVGRAYRLF